MGKVVETDWVIRLVPDLDIVVVMLQELRVLFGTNVDANVDVPIEVRKEILDIVHHGLKFCAVDGERDVATRTQDVIVRGQFPQRLAELMAAIRAS